MNYFDDFTKRNKPRTISSFCTRIKLDLFFIFSLLYKNSTLFEINHPVLRKQQHFTFLNLSAILFYLIDLTCGISPTDR